MRWAGVADMSRWGTERFGCRRCLSAGGRSTRPGSTCAQLIDVSAYRSLPACKTYRITHILETTGRRASETTNPRLEARVYAKIEHVLEHVIERVFLNAIHWILSCNITLTIILTLTLNFDFFCTNNWEQKCAENYNKWQNKLIFQTAVSILHISNHNTFRELFCKIAFGYFFEKIYLYFSIGNGQPGELALCQLYRHTFVPYAPFATGNKHTGHDACRFSGCQWFCLNADSVR